MEEMEKREKRKRKSEIEEEEDEVGGKTTGHPRIAHGQRYPMPCLELLAEEVE